MATVAKVSILQERGTDKFSFLFAGSPKVVYL